MFNFILLHSALINAHLEFSMIQIIKSNIEKKNLHKSIYRYLILFFIAINISFIPCSTTLASTKINVAFGRLSLIDLGALITAKPVVKDKSLVNVYMLSGLSQEENKSIVAIQGLKKSGNTDLIIRTKKHIHQFRIILNNTEGEDLNLNPQNSRTKIIKKPFHLKTQRLCSVSSPSHINEYVLAGNPHLIDLEQIVSNTDPEYLKTFALSTKKQEGNTDIVIASKQAVYKFTIKIGESNEKHTENISLYQR